MQIEFNVIINLNTKQIKYIFRNYVHMKKNMEKLYMHHVTSVFKLQTLVFGTL